MPKSRNRNKEIANTLRKINENSETTAQNTQSANEKLDAIKDNTEEIKKIGKSKIALVITIITAVATVSGFTIKDIVQKSRADEPQYEIYLYSEYSKVILNQATDMTATLNFDTDSVSITAHLASGGSDTLTMERKNSTEWQKKVKFVETGIHEVVATAVAPDGNIVETSIEVEVIPGEIGISIPVDTDLIDEIWQYLY